MDWPIVVILDDDACLRELVGCWVERAGFVPVRVESGPAAVEAVRWLAPLVVVVDLHLGCADGAAVVSSIRAIDPGVRIVLATGETDPAVLEAALARGADDVLQKPFRREALVRTLLPLGA